MIAELLALALFAQFTVPMHTGALATAPAPVSITYVGTCDNGGSGVTTIACTYATVPAGATIAIGVSAGGAASSVTDSVDGTATQVGSNLTFNGTYGGNIWYIKNATAGSHTITAHWGATINITRLKVMIFSGASTTAPIDPFTAGTGIGSGTSTTAATNNFTTANANEMVVGFVWAEGGPAVTSTVSPYTLVVGASSPSMGSVYGIQSTAGTYTASAGIASSAAWGMMAMALKQ